MEKYIDVAEAIQTPSALTQESGDIIFNEIDAALKDNMIVRLDFINVESMISPFLNNAIGKLYKDYTSEQLSKSLIFENFPSTKNATLNLVISNAKAYYSNKEVYLKAMKDVIMDE